MSSPALRSSGRSLAGGAAGPGAKPPATAPRRAVGVAASAHPNLDPASTRILGNGSALWLPRELLAYDVLVGQAQKQQRSMDRLDRHGRSGPPAAPRRPSARGARLLPAGGDGNGGAFFDVTDYSVAEPGASPSSPTTAVALSSSRGGGGAAVVGGLAAPQHRRQQNQFNDGSSPRRTRRVAWTCNLCGSRKVSPVNPLAWEQGSVFFRCQGCDVVHKVKDNLKIFHELAGQVYPPSSLAGGGGGLPPRAAAAAEAALRKWNQGKS